jgi:hypothetical protein
MMRATSTQRCAIPFAAAIAVLAIATSAQAATSFDVTVEIPAAGRPLDALLPGDEFSLAIRVTADFPILAIDASAFGYDESVVDFVSGEAVPIVGYPLDPFLCWTVALCSLIQNIVVPEALRSQHLNGSVTESAIGTNGHRALFLRALPTLNSFGISRIDPGLDPFDRDSPQFRLVFRAMGMGRAVINVGTGYPGDGVVGPGGTLDTSANTPIAIQVIPEPTTGILMGLGLIALSARGRRGHRELTRRRLRPFANCRSIPERHIPSVDSGNRRTAHHRGASRLD